MSAVVIIRELLLAHAPLYALVPPARVHVGSLPQNWAPPAVLVSSLGGNPIQTTARNLSIETIRERVQVTVYAKTYPEQEALLLAAKLGKGVHSGIVRGYHCNAVVPLGTNPAIPQGDDGIFERSRDFMVTFSEAN